MPPLRRAPRSANPAATPYAKGWLSRCRRRRNKNKARRRSGNCGGAPATTLPDVVLFGVISRACTEKAGVARCASTCRRWARVVATRAAAISRALPTPARYLPRLALGVLHGPEHVARRAPSGPQPQPRFVPTATASSRLSFAPDDHDLLPMIAEEHEGGLSFDGARPVASRNGRLVLELRRRARANGLNLCVCNPMTGDVAVLPPLAGDAYPGYYACAILTGDDLLPDGAPPGFFFRLVLVYNRRGFTALRCYTSGAGWAPESRKPGAKISAQMLRQLGPAVVLRGVAYWPMHRAAFGVRLVDGGGAGGATMDVCSVPYRLPHFQPNWHLLGVSPDGERLSYVRAGRCEDALSIRVETLRLDDEASMSTAAGRWERHEPIKLPGFMVPAATPVKLRWFGDRSGTLIFTIGEGGRRSGAFALNLATRSVEKLADGVDCSSWRNVYGYEMDRAALLALSVRPGCLL